MAKAKTAKPKAASRRSTSANDGADDAIRALKAGDWNGGLAALNALWATVHCDKLAAEIERLSAHALASSPALDGEGATLQKAWEKACASGSLVGLEHLLSVIRDGTAPDFRARFDRLRERAPDPRMTMLVSRFANELHLRSDQTRAVWTAFFKLVAHTGDPRARKQLQKLAALARTVIDKSRSPKWEKFEQYLVKQIPAVVDKLPEAGTYGGLAALRMEIDALVKKPFVASAAKATDFDSLYAIVLDDPSDVAARQVWADALLEAGDDRGVFVALQLEAERRPLTAAETKQRDQLLAANRMRWLGEAGAAIEAKTASFRRGVLDSAELSKKASTDDLAAREFRTVAQLSARSPELLAHPNLVSLTRLGRSLVPDPHATTGPVGFEYMGPSDFDWDEVTILAKQIRRGITHLEMSLPEDCNVDLVKHAFPALDTVMVNYSWSSNGVKVFEVLIPWLAKMREVVLRDMTYANEANDAWFVDRLPTSNVHFIFGGGEAYRSYIRRGGRLHAIFTDSSAKGGFSDRGRRDAVWINARTAFIKNMPAVDSLEFRQRSLWLQFDVDTVAAKTKGIANVTLPKSK